MDYALSKKVTASGVVTAKPGIFMGLILGTDGTNDPAITLNDNESAASGEEIMPTTTFDASALGLNGFMPGFGSIYHNGLYISITCAGTVEVTIFYRPWP